MSVSTKICTEAMKVNWQAAKIFSVFIFFLLQQISELPRFISNYCHTANLRCLTLFFLKRTFCNNKTLFQFIRLECIFPGLILGHYFYRYIKNGCFDLLLLRGGYFSPRFQNAPLIRKQSCCHNEYVYDRKYSTSIRLQIYYTIEKQSSRISLRAISQQKTSCQCYYTEW